MASPRRRERPEPTVLWEDPSAVAVLKPSGVLVHNSSYAGPRERTLVEDVERAFGERLNPVHRLDRGTSGIVLFARGAQAAAAWQAALAAEDTRKEYLALVRGHLADRVEVDHPIPDERGVRGPARSTFAPLGASAVERCGLVAGLLHTGRTHQARRHLKHLSHPILGDATHGKGPLNRYFAATYGLGRLALHARRLALRTPAGAAVTIDAPVPADLLGPLLPLFGEAALVLALDARPFELVTGG